MKRLNESGIKKVVGYIGEDRCKYTNINNNHYILGMFSDEDKSKLEDIGVKLNHVGSLLHEASVDIDEPELEVDDEINAADDADKGKKTNQELEQLATALIPYMDRYFPNKEEMNEVLSALQAQMIDPDEMIDNLRAQIGRIKRHSRKHDEVG